ncbi:hypothetical protein BZA77DRAFT_321667 [Pyronema omphalodes]|nr:hypothetical protein BZA77DRAFT_321667 [Pyronema omphalodes]
MVLGHESSGTIIECEPGIPCRGCRFCKAGSYNLCTAMKFAATPPYDGSLAKFYVLPEDFCVKLPENVGLEEGALVEPLAVGVHVCKLANITAGDKVVVFGAGPVGLLGAATARAFGAAEVVVVDIAEKRLKFAGEYAATGTYDAGKGGARENAEGIRKVFGWEFGADKVIEASGAEASIQTAVFVLRYGGALVQAGMERDVVAFPIVEAAAKELVVKGSFRYAAGDYELAVKLVAEGKVDAMKLVTGRYDFKDAEKAFEETKSGKGIKVLIRGPE